MTSRLTGSFGRSYGTPRDYWVDELASADAVCAGSITRRLTQSRWLRFIKNAASAIVAS